VGLGAKHDLGGVAGKGAKTLDHISENQLQHFHYSPLAPTQKNERNIGGLKMEGLYHWRTVEAVSDDISLPF
jgi:hypothetical protein